VRAKASLFLFLLLAVGGGLAIGYLNPPGTWYTHLVKPGFTPPGWVFAPVWTTLYILIAIAGWRVWRRDRHGPAMKLWWGQIGLNFLWSPVFFSAHRIAAALAIVALLFVAIAAFIVTAWRRDLVAASLFVPYAAWVALATALNAAILVLN
jgi:tryptophan-rich sensory protein